MTARRLLLVTWLALGLGACGARVDAGPTAPRTPSRWTPDAVAAVPPPRWPVASVVLVRDGNGELVVWQALHDDDALAPPPDQPWLLAPAEPLTDANAADFLVPVIDQGIQRVALPDQVFTSGLAIGLGHANLVELALPRATIDGASAAVWPRLTLEQLELSAATLVPGVLAKIIDASPRLRGLTVTDTPLDAAAIDEIVALPALVALGASGTGVTDLQAARMVEHVGLEIVALARTGAGLQAAAMLGTSSLRELHLDDTKLDDAAAAKLAALAPTLERFTASRTRVGDRGLAWLPKATLLRQLEVADTAITDKLVRQLRLPALQEVDLGGRPITAATWIGLLGSAPDLAVAVLGPNARVDDNVAAAVLAHPHLTVLGLGDTSVTSAGLVGLAGTPLLRELDLHGTAVDRLDALSGLGALEVLSLRRTGITSLDVQALLGLRLLASLDVGETMVAESALLSLATLPALRALYADDTDVTAPVITALAGAPALQILTIDGTLVDDAALAPLRARDVRELSIASTNITDGIAPLLSAWPRLRVLSLAGTGVTDAVLPSIAALAALHTLNLSATAVRDVAPLAALPNLATLGLARTQITDTTLATLTPLPLRVVSLARTKLTAAAITTLATWSALREVDLSGVDLGTPRVAQRALAPLDARGVHVER